MFMIFYSRFPTRK